MQRQVRKQKRKKGSQIKKGSGYRTVAECTAVIVHGSREISFPGQKIRFYHAVDSSVMVIDADLVLEGKQLGLPSSQHGPISLRINVTSPPAKVLENDPNKGSDLLDF